VCSTDECEAYEESCADAGRIAVFERLISRCRVHTSAGLLERPKIFSTDAAGAVIGRSDDVLERGHDGGGGCNDNTRNLQKPCDVHAGSRAVKSGVGSTGRHSVGDGRKESFWKRGRTTKALDIKSGQLMARFSEDNIGGGSSEGRSAWEVRYFVLLRQLASDCLLAERGVSSILDGLVSGDGRTRGKWSGRNGVS
jgi:hypothetical protein